MWEIKKMLSILIKMTRFDQEATKEYKTKKSSIILQKIQDKLTRNNTETKWTIRKIFT